MSSGLTWLKTDLEQGGWKIKKANQNIEQQHYVYYSAEYKWN